MKIKNSITPWLILFLLTSLFVHFGSFARELPVKPLAQYIHRTWTSKEGLPYNSTRALVQTRDGYLWVATQNGLARFDGAGFQVFNKGNTPALKHNEITALIESPDSTLWIGTYNGVTSLKNGVFTYHSPDISRKQDVVRTLAEDHAGNLWIGTMNTGLLKYRDGKFDSITSAQGLVNNSVYSLAVDQEDNIWIGTSNGLSVYRQGHISLFKSGSELSHAIIRTIYVAHDSTVWIGTEVGLVKWKNGLARTYTVSNRLSDNVIMAVYEDKSGTLWIGTQRGGIYQFVDNTIIPFRFSDDLSGDYVNTFLEDREGNLWVGMYIAGLNQFWKGKVVNYTTREGLPDRIIRALLRTKDDNVWIGTEGGGVLRFDGKKFKIFNTKNGLPNDFVNSLFEDSHGAIWIGTREGLAQYSHGVFRTYSTKDGLSQNYIRPIKEDHEGHIWVGTYNGGVHRFENGRFVNYYDKGLPVNVIRSILVDHSGAVWVGSNEALMRWQNGIVTTYTTKDGLPFDPIYDMIEDSKGTIWLGSYGGGLVRIKDGKINCYTQAQGLLNDVVFNILDDMKGNFWLASLQGISSVKKQMLNDFADGKINSIQCVTYSSSDGMVVSECSGNAYPGVCMTSDGRLWFSTNGGIVVVDPNNLQQNRLPPPVMIERMVVNRVEYSPHQDIHVPVSEGRVEFHYSGLSYQVPEKVQFRYILEGFETEWRTVGIRRAAFYTNLAPGKYVFRVKACNNDGVWNETGASFAFELEPHFYQTWWFYGLMILSVIGIGVGIYRWRVWTLIRKEKELKKRVDEALAEIKILGGLIPICSNCKKIRDDSGFWNQLEKYIKDHSEASFTHGICPECAEKFYGNIIYK